MYSLLLSLVIIMSKLINLTKENNQKGSLRQFKVNKITKQIQQVLNTSNGFVQIDSMHKENKIHSSNIVSER